MLYSIHVSGISGASYLPDLYMSDPGRRQMGAVYITRTAWKESQCDEKIL